MNYLFHSNMLLANKIKLFKLISCVFRKPLLGKKYGIIMQFEFRSLIPVENRSSRRKKLPAKRNSLWAYVI